jgi:hypothetical protein
MKTAESPKNDKQYSVEISTTPNGEALVKVSVGADTPLVVDAAFGLYTETIQLLKNNFIPVVERKTTN